MRFVLIAILTLFMMACSRPDNGVAREPAKSESSDSVAKKAGIAAHEIADETKEAAKKVGKTIEKAAKEAHEGWKEAERKDKAQHKEK